MVKKKEREKEKASTCFKCNYQFKTFFLVPISLILFTLGLLEFLRHGNVPSHWAVNDFQKHLSCFEVCVCNRRRVWLIGHRCKIENVISGRKEAFPHFNPTVTQCLITSLSANPLQQGVQSGCSDWTRSFQQRTLEKWDWAARFLSQLWAGLVHCCSLTSFYENFCTSKTSHTEICGFQLLCMLIIMRGFSTSKRLGGDLKSWMVGEGAAWEEKQQDVAALVRGITWMQSCVW